MRKKLFLIPLFISLFLLGACSNNSTSQNSESSSNSSSVKTSKLVKSSSQKNLVQLSPVAAVHNLLALATK